MSYFGAKIEELMERNKLTAAELSRASGITEGLLSRWINGVQTFVSHEALEAITPVISRKPTEQAELIRAHLQDECVGAGSQLIDIHILGTGTETRDTVTPYRVPLPLKIQRALELLGRESITDADVRSLLLSLANICQPKTEDGEPAVSSERRAEIADEVTQIVKDGVEHNRKQHAPHE